MMLDEQEFQSAFKAARTEHPLISEALARSFLSKLQTAVRDRTQKIAFPQKLRNALNDSHIWKDAERAPYRFLAGKYFGKRGGRKSAARRINKKRSLHAVSTEKITITVDRDGQLSWRL
jgi:hypothetical protein